MVIDYTHTYQQVPDGNSVCDFLNENRDKIKQVLSITPSLDGGDWVIFYQEYVDKPFKMMREKDWKKLKAKRKQAKLKK